MDFLYFMCMKNLYHIYTYWSDGSISRIDGPMDKDTLNWASNIERWLNKCFPNKHIIKIVKKTICTNFIGKDIIHAYMEKL